jgi:hypothetical protein
MGDVLNGYQNLQNGTLDVVVHEWAPNLNTSLEKLSFYIVSTSIILKYLSMCMWFVQISNIPSTMCKDTILKLQPKSMMN